MFKELYRRYPVAEVEDYFKAGKWKDDVMRIDLRLVEAHRKEGGAPEPMEMADVPEPVLPKTNPLLALASSGALGRPAVPAAGGLAGAIAAAKAAAAAKAGGLRPTGAGAAPGTVGPVTELRLIAIFVAKWKLDPTRTKAALARLTPARRRYVIQNFKTVSTGPTASVALDQFIAKCEQTNAWGSESASMQAGPPAKALAMRPGFAAARPVRPGLVAAASAGPRPLALRGAAAPKAQTAPTAGVKRPLASILGSMAANEANKKAKIAVAPAMRPASPATRPAGLAMRPAGLAMRPVAPAMRPVGPAMRPAVQPTSSAMPPARGKPAGPKPPTPVLNMRPAMGGMMMRPAQPKGLAAQQAVARPAGLVAPNGPKMSPSAAKWGQPAAPKRGQPLLKIGAKAPQPPPGTPTPGSFIQSLLQKY